MPTTRPTRDLVSVAPGASPPATTDPAMPGSTHTSLWDRSRSYDGRGPLTGTPTASATTTRLVAGARRVAGLPAQRRLVPEPRRESPVVPVLQLPTCTPDGLRALLEASDVAYVGVHQPNEQGRRCRSCPISTTWPHGYCSRCTAEGRAPSCSACAAALAVGPP